MIKIKARFQRFKAALTIVLLMDLLVNVLIMVSKSINLLPGVRWVNYPYYQIACSCALVIIDSMSLAIVLLMKSTSLILFLVLIFHFAMLGLVLTSIVILVAALFQRGFLFTYCEEPTLCTTKIEPSSCILIATIIFEGGWILLGKSCLLYILKELMDLSSKVFKNGEAEFKNQELKAGTKSETRGIMQQLSQRFY